MGMGLNLRYVHFCLFCLLWCHEARSQCNVVSSHGWVASLDVTTTAVIPEFLDCPWYYHYEIRFIYDVTFSGSASNRSVSGNIYFMCSGGSGGNPFVSLGTVTADYSGVKTTSNLARQYTAGSAYNYGSNPSCQTITLADVNCTSAYIDYWGSGVTSATCTTSTNVLPIELLAFRAVHTSKGVEVTWSTASEVNNDYFTVERSSDSENWEEVATVKGAGNSNTPLSYNITDIHPLPGKSYYRLKQTDFDGTSTYSHVAVIAAESPVMMQVYADHSSGEIFVSSNERLIKVRLRNNLGQVVPAPTRFVGHTAILTPRQTLCGIYFVELLYDGGTAVEKVVLN